MSFAVAGPLGKCQPTISHYTRVLSGAGLIVGEKRGRWMWWRIAGQMQPLRVLLGGRSAQRVPRRSAGRLRQLLTRNW